MILFKLFIGFSLRMQLWVILQILGVTKGVTAPGGGVCLCILCLCCVL